MFFYTIEELYAIDRVHFFSDPSRVFTRQEVSQINKIIKQLQKYKPVQYIFGKAWFHGIVFTVDSSVLIPRPETEEMVEIILNGCRHRGDASQKPRILDIGTGSGCIAVTLAKYIEGSQVWGCDNSPSALEIALKNADKQKVSINWFLHDVLLDTELPVSVGFDIIVSNPPYIREKEKTMMKPNVLAFEPEEALFVGDQDPLVFYRHISGLARQWLNPGGKLYVEINEAFGKGVKKLMKENDLQDITIINDIHGKDRFVVGGKGIDN